MVYRLGQQVGNYRLVRRLGRGGFAEVYLGEHRHLKSYAALKMLQFSLTTDEEVQRFLTEARMLVGLRHPNIVRVLDYDVDRGTPVLVMDYAPGGTIRQRHPRGSILSLALTVAYVKQVAAALQYAYDRHIIHRDVKPENILLGPDSTLLLSDFGLALFSPTPEQVSTQDMAGTCPYMAPEQFEGKPTFASDQYALGVVTYEWLCGKRPFEGTSWQLAYQHRSVEPPPLREHYPELPIAVEQVVLKALAKKPEDRFASIQAFAEALERASQADYADNNDAEITLPRIPKPPGTPLAPAKPDVQTLQPVFLSAAPADAEFAARLKTDLQKQGVLFSNDSVSDALEQEEVMRQAIRAAQFVLVILSPETRSSRLVKDHMRVANMYRRQILFVRMAGDEVGEMLPIPDTWGETTVIDVVDARESSYAPALKKLVARLVQDTESSTSPASPRAEPLREPRNPYKGLRAFTQSEATDFFGRDALIDKLVETLKAALINEYSGNAGMRLLTVLGPSGSGKSSVVMAGLLPRLQQGGLFESKQWLYLDPFVPGTHPLESLVRVLVPHLPSEDKDSIREMLGDDSARGLHLLTSRLTGHSGASVLLVIDQFEELFAQHLPEQEQQHFIDLLLTAVTERGGPVIAVLTLRADYYDRPMRYPQLSRLIEACHVSVLPMELHDLRAVIEEPAYQPDVQLTFEANLVGDLLFEAQGQAGALPLLEFTLDQLYQHREGHWLTLNAYQEIGGVKGALIRHAESTYASLPSEQHRTLARTLFLRLLDPGMTEQDTTRRRASMSELSLPDEQETRMLRTVADAFVDSRLLTTSEVAGEVTIEVSHEALIREWERLTKWLREAREDILLQQAISADVTDWVKRGKPADRLYRGTKLAEAQIWAGRNTPNRGEAEFLRTSAEEQQRQEREEHSRQERELTMKRQTVNRLRALVVVLTLLLIVSVVFAAVARSLLIAANDAKAAAEVQAKRASSRALAANASIALSQNELDLALLLSVKALQTEDTYEARNSLLAALERHPHIVTMVRSGHHDPILTLTFGSDDYVFIASDNFRVYVWNTQTRGHPVLTFDKQEYVGGVALSPDNRILAIANSNGVWLWDSQTGTALPALDGSTQKLSMSYQPRTPIVFSPDGKRVMLVRCSQYTATSTQELPACVETRIYIWDVQSQQLLALHRIQENPDVVAFSPDGQRLALSSGTRVRLWSVTTGQPLGSPFPGNTDTITSMVFSLDGLTLACGSSTNTQLWNVASGQSSGPPLTLQNNAITSLAFAPSGQLLASGSSDKTVQVWNRASGKLITLTGDAQEKESVAFSPDGTLLLSGSNDGTVLLWNLNATNTISRSLTDTGMLSDPVFSPDGKTVFVGSADGKVLLYDILTGRLAATLDTANYPLIPRDTGKIRDNLHSILSLALSKDGRRVVAGRLDGSIIFWDRLTGQTSRSEYPSPLYRIALSLDGQFLAASGGGGVVTLWNVTKRTRISTLPYQTSDLFRNLPIALSRDGERLAVGGCAQVITDRSCDRGQVQLWNVATGKAERSLFGHKFAVSAVAFSPDGGTLASSSHDGIILWDIATGTPKGPMLSLATSNADYSGNLLFSPHGMLLASYSALSSPFSFVLWDMAQQKPLADPIQEEDYFRGGLAFSPTETRLLSVALSASSSDKGVLTLWDIDPRLWQEHACTIANRDLTPDEWRQFAQDEGRQSKVCPNLVT